MKSYFLSILGWISASFLTTLAIAPLIGGEGGAFMLSIAIIFSPLFGLTGNLVGSYLIKTLKLKILHPFTITLIGSLIFFLFFVLLSILGNIDLLGLSQYQYLKIIVTYIIIIWVVFWIVGGLILTLINFLHKTKEKAK